MVRRKPTRAELVENGARRSGGQDTSEKGSLNRSRGGRTGVLQKRTRLFGGAFFVQGGADSEGRVGIDGAVAFVDQLDDALLVDDDVGAKGPLVGLVLNVVPFQDAVGLEHPAVHIAEERESDTDLFGEGGVGGGTVH